LDHSSTGFYTALIVLAVPAVPAMPGVRPLNHPAFFPRREALRARRTHLHFDVPASTRFGHPGVQGMIVILLVRKNRAETRKVLWRDVKYQDRKSTRLNSSHVAISYAVFCLKKKKQKRINTFHSNSH